MKEWLSECVDGLQGPWCPTSVTGQGEPLDKDICWLDKGGGLMSLFLLLLSVVVDFVLCYLGVCLLFFFCDIMLVVNKAIFLVICF